MRPRSRRPRGRRAGASQGRARARRDLGRLRRDRERGHRPTGAPARARPCARRAPDRAQLPRYRRGGAAPERDLRVALGGGGQHRVLVPERCARPGAARGGGHPWPRAVGLRLDRQQGRRLDERPARVVGGGSRDRGDPPVRRVLREPAPLRADRTPRCETQAATGAQERHVGQRPTGGELAHRRARGLRRRGRRAVPPGRRDPGRDARGADRRRGAPLQPGAPGRPLRRDHDQRRRARDPLRRRLRGGGARAAEPRRRDRLGAPFRASGRVQRREPRRHAGRCDGPDVRGGAAAPARRLPCRRGRRPVRARRQRDGGGGRGGGRRRRLPRSTATSRCSR